jgi:hypothetical protein
MSETQNVRKLRDLDHYFGKEREEEWLRAVEDATGVQALTGIIYSAFEKKRPVRKATVLKLIELGTKGEMRVRKAAWAQLIELIDKQPMSGHQEVRPLWYPLAYEHPEIVPPLIKVLADVEYDLTKPQKSVVSHFAYFCFTAKYSERMDVRGDYIDHEIYKVITTAMPDLIRLFHNCDLPPESAIANVRQLKQSIWLERQHTIIREVERFVWKKEVITAEERREVEGHGDAPASIILTLYYVRRRHALQKALAEARARDDRTTYVNVLSHELHLLPVFD